MSINLSLQLTYLGHQIHDQPQCQQHVEHLLPPLPPPSLPPRMSPIHALQKQDFSLVQLPADGNHACYSDENCRLLYKLIHSLPLVPITRYFQISPSTSNSIDSPVRVAVLFNIAQERLIKIIKTFNNTAACNIMIINISPDYCYCHNLILFLQLLQ